MNPPKRKAGVHAGRGPLPIVHQPLYPWVDYCNLRALREKRCGEKGDLDWILFVNTSFYRLRLDGRWTQQKDEEYKGGKNLTVMKVGNFPSVRELITSFNKCLTDTKKSSLNVLKPLHVSSHKLSRLGFYLL